MKKVRYCSVMAVWAGLALGYFQSTLPANADTLTFVDVPASDARAQCHTGGGTWTFTITNLTGKISQVNVQLYTAAAPTNEDRVCGFTLGGCGGNNPNFSKAAEASIKKPAVGKSVQITGLSADSYCVRVVTVGSPGSSVTVQLTHP